jgi:hypothetical protein
VKDKEEDKESPNSHTIIEVGLIEKPLTLGFDSQMLWAKDVELPNSFEIVAVNLDEIPSTSNVDFAVLRLLIAKVNPFHVIFDLNGIFIATRFDKGSHTIIFCFGLKEFLEKCLAQFQVYIWSTTQHHNIYNYLNHI